MRKKIPMNFSWKYSEHFDDAMTKIKFDDTGFKTVDIPHSCLELPYNYFDERSYQFICCYRKNFTLPAEAFEHNRRVFLHFEGAANLAKVYLNGKFIGEHKGGYTPFVFEITDTVNKRSNQLTVSLDTSELKNIPPFGHMVDYLVYGGIYREVWLEITENDYIEDVYVTTPNVLYEYKMLSADVTFSGRVSGVVQLSVYDGDNRLIAQKETNADGKVLRVRWNIRDAKLWDLDTPYLYTLTVRYKEDSFSRRFGFREAKFTRTGFMLNGKKIKLMGLNRHQSYPYVGYAMPKSAQVADAELLKYTLGCNIVRTSHYPDSVHFLDACDEIGLLVFTEMPSWQYLGEGEWRENCLNNIRDMIVRDRSHPSIVLWGVRVNEGNDCDEFYAKTNELARNLDGSRQTGGVRNMPRSHLLEDVYTYNDFSHSGGKIRLLPPAVVTGLNAPYLVTEYNGHMYPTKSFDREEIRREHALRHLRVQECSHGNRRISGAIGWCMADYNTHKDFGSGDRICYHGVTDMFRVPKLAASVYASQQDKIPVMENSSAMDVGEYPGAIVGQTYIFTNCDYVKVYKNGEYKSIAYPDSKRYPHLKHPPILPVDFIGDALTKEEGLDEKTANALKDALVTAGVRGFILPPKYYLKAVYALVHGKMKFQQAYNIVTKYFANWGDEQITYRFDGYKDGELVKSITRTAVDETRLCAKADKTELALGDTYDVTRIELKATDRNGNQLPFASNAIEVSVEGAGKIIGPDTFSLIGGDRAFWVRTVGKKGVITVKIAAQDMETVELKLTVR